MATAPFATVPWEQATCHAFPFKNWVLCMDNTWGHFGPACLYPSRPCRRAHHCGLKDSGCRRGPHRAAEVKLDQQTEPRAGMTCDTAVVDFTYG